MCVNTTTENYWTDVQFLGITNLFFLLCSFYLFILLLNYILLFVDLKSNTYIENNSNFYYLQVLSFFYYYVQLILTNRVWDTGVGPVLRVFYVMVYNTGAVFASNKYEQSTGGLKK